MKYPSDLNEFIAWSKNCAIDLKDVKKYISREDYIDASFTLGAIWNDFHLFLVENCPEYKKDYEE